MRFQYFQIIFLCLYLTIVAAITIPYTIDKNGFAILQDTAGYRLPNNTRPELYDISLVTNIDQSIFNFSGIVRINVLVLNTSREITLHARELTIKSIQLKNNANGDIPLAPFTYNSDTEFLTIPTNKVDLQAGKKYTLEIEYDGVLHTNNAGFFRSSYLNANGTKTWLAATKFKPTNARHAFPCYDEPGIKANFTIHIQHGASYHAISNMPGTRNLNPDQTVTTNFATTPPTSTYLIAFIVSDFKYKDNGPNSKFPLRVYAKPTEVESATFAVTESEKILNALANYLDIPFPLPKMDQVALNQIDNVNENWGLATYDEEKLLLKSADDLKTKTQIVANIAQGFGYQLFGNLVSPKWWTYSWINEGFAELFQYVGTDLVQPDWDAFQFFIENEMNSALENDATHNARPMSFYVESPQAISDLFFSRVNSKPASVIRMFMQAFTQKSFKKGLKYYLTEKAYSNADEDDLFAALERAVKEDGTLDKRFNVKDIFRSWSDQKHFPLLTVKLDYDGCSLNVSQERYFKVPSKETDSTTWWIPYTVVTANQSKEVVTRWLPQNTRSMIVEPNPIEFECDSWVLVNQQRTGFYRVLYDERNYKLLFKQLISGSWESFDTFSRTGLIDDLSDFTKNGRLPYSLLFDLFRYLERETEYAPWMTALRPMVYIDDKFAGSTKYNSYKTFIASIVKPFYDTIVLAPAGNESYQSQFLKVIFADIACRFGVESCLRRTHTSLVNLLNSGEIEPFTAEKSIIYTHGTHMADRNLIEALWDRLTKTTDLFEKQSIWRSFRNVADQELLQYCLNRTLAADNSSRNIITRSIIRGSQLGLATAISFLAENIDKAYTQYRYFESLFGEMARQIRTKQLYKEFLSLLQLAIDKNYIQNGTIEQMKDIVKENFEWIEKYQASIENYFPDDSPTSN